MPRVRYVSQDERTLSILDSSYYDTTDVIFLQEAAAATLTKARRLDAIPI